MKKIKTKLMFGIFLVFLISFIVLMINITSNQGIITKNQSLLKNNYPSVKYSFEMLKIIDELNTTLVENRNKDNINHREDSIFFEKRLLKEVKNYLALQNSNVTETGEEQLTGSLNSSFNKFYSSISNKEHMKYYLAYKEKYLNLREYILSIYELNVKVLEQKNQDIGKNAQQILKVQEKIGIAGLAILCVLIFVLPILLINPIDKLTERMIDFYKTNFNKDIKIESNHELEKLEEIFEKIVLETSADKATE